LILELEMEKKVIHEVKLSKPLRSLNSTKLSTA
jgi:hypothetical protein